jgi:hypothetical protein
MRRTTWTMAFLALLAGCGGSGDDGGTGGANTAGAAGASGAGGSSGSSGDAGSAGSSGSAGSAGGICQPACEEWRRCCGGQCANTANDPNNCGSCGVECASGTYCDGTGKCAPPPCSATCSGGALCCGSECCGAGELCCDPQGPISQGPVCTPPDERGTCPMGCAPLCVCASPDTPIATPSGERPIASLRAGDLVYSAERGGVKVVRVLSVRRAPVQAHRIMRITLANGTTLELSPGHPTADGRRFQDLRAGDALDGVPITSAAIAPYAHDATYDILPDSESGAYFAGGVLVGSTLAPAANASRVHDFGVAWSRSQEK